MSGNLSTSFRQNYSAFGGVDQYYERYGQVYRNPHESIIVKLIKGMMEKWTTELDPILNNLSLRCFPASLFSTDPSGADLSEEASKDLPYRVLDLACGSGEAGLALEGWFEERIRQHLNNIQKTINPLPSPDPQQSAPSCPSRFPNEEALRLVFSRLSLDFPEEPVLVPAKGEVPEENESATTTVTTEESVAPVVVEEIEKRPIVLIREKLMTVQGVDPYTPLAYKARTGKECLTHTFQDVEMGALGDQTYDLIICSFALHLLEKSKLFGICTQLAFTAPCLIILTPHKKPHISATCGWQLLEEILFDRVRARIYQSLFFVPPS